MGESAAAGSEGGSYRDLAAALSVRVLIALLGIVVVRTTRGVLGDADFVRYGLALFAVALSGTALFPLNRRFWAEYAAPMLMRTVKAGIAVQGLLIVPILAVLLAISAPTGLAQGAMLAAAMVVFTAALIVSRYLYGSLAMQKRLMAGTLYTLAFVSIELAVLGGMAAGGVTPLWVRMAVPGAIFLALVPLLNRVLDQRHMGVRDPSGAESLLGDALREIGGRVGLLTVAGSVFLTAASMIDRAAFPILCRTSAVCENAADPVLIAIYCSAYLSILLLVLDWLRPRVYANDAWQGGAARAMQVGLGLLALAFLAAISIGWFAGRATGLIPDAIEWTFWAAMVLRFTLLAAINIAQIDLWMSRRIGLAVPGCAAAAAAMPLALVAAPLLGLAGAMAVADALVLGVFGRELLAHRRRRRIGSRA